MRRIIICILAFALMFSTCGVQAFAEEEYEEEEYEGTSPKIEVNPVLPIPDPPKVKLALSVKGEITLYQGQTYRVHVTQIDPDEQVGVWSSSNNNICTVKNGLVHAGEKTTGTAVISVSAFGHGIPDSANFRVKVVKPARPYSIRNLPKKIRLRRCRKKKYRIRPVVSPCGMLKDVKYKSLNRKIATVSKKGVVRAKRRGKTWVVVKCGKYRKKIRIIVR